MRRGHPGSGWRSENPRHFRPRISGSQQFRPSRGYGLPDQHRFPPMGPRVYRGPPSYSRSGHLESHGTPDHHERSYSGHQNHSQRSYDRGYHQDSHQIRPLIPQLRMGNRDIHTRPYKDSSSYYKETREGAPCLINNMGDVDLRQHANSRQPRDFGPHPISPWAQCPPLVNNQHYEDWRHHNSNKNVSGDINKIPLLDHPSQIPVSAQYEKEPATIADKNNTSFSRSIDDTVDIVRKRLLNRIEPQNTSDHNVRQNDVESSENVSDIYQNIQPQQPTKRKSHRHRQSNCDQIKNKIVHQLFKMDKTKIHKLMDNPESSSKFEFAISSLITESQNSLNRQMRSMAEKSLSAEHNHFINDDSNTIYEDTFMKQMQDVLDPQDTVLLEDIKPLVMEELNKFLQLNEFDQRFEAEQDMFRHHTPAEPSNFETYDNEYSYEDLPFEYNNNPETRDEIVNNTNNEPEQNYDNNKNTEYKKSQPLFERRPSKKEDYSEERRISSESRRQNRKSLDTRISELEATFINEEVLPLFENSTELLSEDEDPFADLDNQYHVAVDHNFIETDDLFDNQQSLTSSKPVIPTSTETNILLQTPCKSSVETENPNIRHEIESQLESIAKSPLKLFSSNNNQSDNTSKCIKQEICTSTPGHQKAQENVENKELLNLKKENVEGSRDNETEITNNLVKSSTLSSNRKRSIDQRPSHRKEKRKKSESTQPTDTNKQILNKNIIINVNDCAAKSKEKCHDAAKSIFNLFFSKEENKEILKDVKKTDSSEKVYSDKYVKRKDSQSKHKDTETKKTRTSSISGHSNIKSKESTFNTSQSTNKLESNKKLKTIDLFTEQPKKVHQAHRNTAPTAVIKREVDTKSKVIQLKPTKKHVSTQVIKKFIAKETQTFESKSTTSRFCQTEKKKSVTRDTQTDPVIFVKSTSNSTDVFERMKEIDMEIQILLQEKFKLYSSLESKNNCPQSMQNLGMTVLNVPFEEKNDEEIYSENILPGDSIVEDFTNIPVEELEQIAFESVVTVSEPITSDKKVTRGPKKMSQSESVNPIRKRITKAKTPNISLIEQIITDDRPIEEIISLDDLEHVEQKNLTARPKRKPIKRKPTKKTKTKIGLAKPIKSKSLKQIVLDHGNHDVKECSVVLIRENLNKYLNNHISSDIPQCITPIKELVPNKETNKIVDVQQHILQDHEFNPEIDETLVNDIQFDMLDVSEDIVIGDNCEVKSVDKDLNEQIDVPISEEIILDNSQSSMEDAVGTEESQSDNECKLYDYSADEKLRRDSVTLTGNADAVLAIESIEDNFIAACLDGNVYYFNGEGHLLNTLRGSNLAVTCLTIVKEKYGTTVYTGSLDSRIRYYDLETGLEKGPECNVLSPIQTMDRAWDTIFVGTRTGFVLQFECKNNMLIPVSTVKFADQSILALRALKEGPRKVLLVAARSENVTIKDAQTGLLLRTLDGPKMTVYTLLFEEGKVYCGTSSHQIYVFDYSNGSHVGSHEGGKGAVCLRASGGLLFAGCYDGCVYVYREGETRPLAQLRGPSLMLLSLAIVGTKIIAGYKDRSLYMWKIPLAIVQEMIL